MSLRTYNVARGVLPLLLAAAMTAPLFAEQSYLPAGQPDGIALLAPPPAAGSPEEAADLASVRAVFKGRSSSEEARAMKDASLAFSLFAPAIGPAFDLSKLPKTETLLKKVRTDASQAIDTPKDHWQRRRPYVLDPQLWLGNPEKSFSYPSGHSTRGTLYALILAELFPEKTDGILAIGRTIGWDRVLIAKHFPTDIYAGRVLGKAIFRELLASEAFRRDLADAKAEIGTVRAVAEKPREQAAAPAVLHR